MADRLVLDTQLLHEAGASLRVVATEFTHADAHSDGVADAVGHQALAARVRDFAHSWDDRREKIVESVEALAQTATDVGGAFEQLEDSFVAALEGRA